MGRTNGGISHLYLGAASAIVLAAAAGVFTAAPDASAQGRAASDSLSVRKERVLMYERSFRPSTYDAPLPPLSSSPGSDTSASASMSSGIEYAAPETVQGFRIQVLNTNSYDESSSMRTSLLETFDTWWVYVLYDAPTYKVRIGDFATRLEAKSALEQILAKGFTNAWLVPDKVVLHLPPRMPLALPIDSSLVK